MDEKLENISILNVVNYILFMSGDIFDKPTLMHISVVGILISFFFSLWMCIRARHLKDEGEKRRLVRCINSLIFCSFFVVFYFVKVW